MKLTHQQISIKGGKGWLKKYGKERYSEMGKKGAIAKVSKYGKDYYREFAIKGLRGRLNKGMITQDTFDAAVLKINNRVNATPE